jgi:hypothetical protein
VIDYDPLAGMSEGEQNQAEQVLPAKQNQSVA